MLPKLDHSQIERIANIIAEHYTGSQIVYMLNSCNIRDVEPNMSKAKRLLNAFIYNCNNCHSTNGVYQVIKFCLNPARGLDDTDNYDLVRLLINQVLMLVGVEIRDDGEFYQIIASKQLSEIQRRTRELKKKLTINGAHHIVLSCCKEEWLSEDYFHAVHEAAKSLADRVRELTGLSFDGAQLFETALKVSDPYIALNKLQTNSEKNQQNGMREMLCGVFHMVRNVTAHELRIRWDINENDAIDILTQVSYLHKLLDICVIVKKA